MWRILSLLGPWKWLNLALVVPVPAASFAFYWYPQFQLPSAFAADASLPTQPLGPWSVALRTSEPLQAGAEIRWTLQLCSGCGTAVRSVELAWGTRAGPTGEPAIAQGSADQRVLVLRVPDPLPGDGLHVWASAPAAQALHRTHWDLERMLRH